MFSIERQQKISHLLRNKKSVTVSELSKIFFIGEATIRRDLEKLEKKGLIKRIYGGAVLLEGLDAEVPLSVREVEQKGEKDIIGRFAAQLVHDGDIIIMDSSSTTLKMVPYLKSKKNLTVVTNGARTSVELAESGHAKVYCTGGLLRENSLSYIGESARRSIESHYADILFFSCRGITMGRGIFDSNENEAELRRMMIQNCRKSILLCDHTKFDQISFCKICGFDMIHSIVTDQKPSALWSEFIKSQNVVLITP